MDYVKAINYTGFNYQCFGEEGTKENLLLMKQKTACNTLILVLGALQDESFSKWIDYTHAVMPKDADLTDFIRYAKSIGLKVFLKPVIDCRSGACRADIDFLENGSFCEERWESWKKNYIEFILHYAMIAEKTRCEMFFAGCRLLKIENQTAFWTKLIQQIRQCYHGLLTYEAGIYNEDNVKFWEKLDIIASEGNYSKLYLEKELERLVQLADSYKKPLLLTECGCMSTKGASISPNAWEVDGELSLHEQAAFFENLLNTCKKQENVKGIGIWCWNNRRQSKHAAIRDKRYFIYGKPACNIIYEIWNEE